MSRAVAPWGVVEIWKVRMFNINANNIVFFTIFLLRIKTFRRLILVIHAILQIIVVFVVLYIQ